MGESLCQDCLVRLKIIDPKLFLSDNEVRSFSVNTVEEKSSKLSDCEKSFFKKKDGSIGCLCDERVAPPEFNQNFYEKLCRYAVEKGGENIAEDLSGLLK